MRIDSLCCSDMSHRLTDSPREKIIYWERERAHGMLWGASGNCRFWEERDSERARAARGGWLSVVVLSATNRESGKMSRERENVAREGKKSHVEGIFSFFFCCENSFCRRRASNDELRQLFLRVFPEMLRRRRRRWGRDLPFYVWYCPFLRSVAVGTFLGLHAAQFFGEVSLFWRCSGLLNRVSREFCMWQMCLPDWPLDDSVCRQLNSSDLRGHFCGAWGFLRRISPACDILIYTFPEENSSAVHESWQSEWRMA